MDGQININYLLRIFTKKEINGKLFAIDIILDNIYDFETFELWLLNSKKGIHKITSCTETIHYLNREEILAVTLHKCFFDGEEYKIKTPLRGGYL